MPRSKRKHCYHCYRNAYPLADAVSEGKSHWVFIEIAARGEQPDAIEPQNHQRDNEPKQSRLAVELHHIGSTDIDGEDDHRGISTGGAEAAHLRRSASR